MFSQVTKTSAIFKHAIHFETIVDFVTLLVLRIFFSADDLDLRRDACSSYNEPSLDSSRSTSEMTPTRLERTGTLHENWFELQN
jgi:hypothetical protein